MYRIVVRGRLTERLAPAFDRMTLVPSPGRTVLVGDLADQASLFGVLDRLRDLGIELLEVRLPEPEAER
jgi:hypothetical protein